jgi:hypothetical protein
MISMIAMGLVDHGLGQLSETKDYEFGICCFSMKHAALRVESKERLASGYCLIVV